MKITNIADNIIKVKAYFMLKFYNIGNNEINNNYFAKTNKSNIKVKNLYCLQSNKIKVCYTLFRLCSTIFFLIKCTNILLTTMLYFFRKNVNNYTY